MVRWGYTPKYHLGGTTLWLKCSPMDTHNEESYWNQYVDLQLSPVIRLDDNRTLSG
jgi:hypothetical protein